MPLLRIAALLFVLVFPPASLANDAEPASSWSLLDWLSRQWRQLQNIDTPEHRLSFGGQSPIAGQEYLVGIHPLHNPKRLFEVYGPIVEHINARMPGVALKLEASTNYEEFEKKLYAGHFDFAMPNPYQTMRSLAYGYRVFGKMGDDQDFRGIILIRKDSGIKEVADLKGKAVSYPAKSALAATMMPQMYLQAHGLNINTDIDNRYVGSQESSIMNVLLGHVAAAATWPVPWKAFCAQHPRQAAELEVKWQTEALINNGWVVRNDVPAELAGQFAMHLFDLQNSEEGRKLLEAVPVSRFEAATDQTYDPVKIFLETFNKTVRPIE